MSERIFPNWLDSYCQYADDSFVPPSFNKWAGLSVLAGAMERKCWLPWSETHHYYPNIFVFMVSMPGVGKSTALNKAVDLLREMNSQASTMNILPSSVTAAELVELLGNKTGFEIGGKTIQQSAGYYWTSEASDTLKVGGYYDITSNLTNLYDCPALFEHATKKEGKKTLRNVCMNLIAACTFDYLGKLVTNDNIMGGFASRVIYVVHRGKLVRNQRFQLGGDGNEDPARMEFRKALVHDLAIIHKMVGAFSATQEFCDAWEEWYPKFEAERQENPSEKMQSLLVRTNTNVMKVSMLMSAAQSNDRLLTREHWERTLETIEPIGKDIPNIFRQAKALDNWTQDGLNQAILQSFSVKEEMTVNHLKAKLLFQGFNPRNIDLTVNTLMTIDKLKVVSNGGSDVAVKFVGNTQDHL